MSGAGVGAAGDRIARFFVLVATLSLAALLLAPAGASAECSVRGNVYDWSTFEPVNNAIVDVFSIPDGLPVNHLLARTGSYAFSLPAGSYMIVATAGGAGTPSEITATENVTVPGSGERIVDLILFPPGSLDDLAGFNDGNATPTLPPDEGPTTQPGTTTQPAGGVPALCLGGGAIALAVVAIAAGLVLLRALKPKPPATAPPVEPTPVSPPEAPAAAPPATPPAVPPAVPGQPSQPPQPQQPPQATPSVQELLLPDDCREVLAIMEKNDGRITQLDLRKALPYSEAKVSLIVSDLESRGLIKKIKKGRGNVLIMVRPGEKPPENNQ